MALCDYRLALQSATAPLHAEIDALYGLFDLAERDGLARFLAAHAIGMRACQPRTTRFGRQGLDTHAPDYSAMLVRDLAVLGIDAALLPQLELADGDLPHGDLRADAGIFYVVAGSRMGAAVLRDRATAPTPDGPARSTCGYFVVGEGPAMWRLFREWLAREGRADTAPDGLPTMIAAARASFALFALAAQWAAAQSALPRLTGTAPAPEESAA